MTLLPEARNTTYNAATPVKSGDLDDIQDMLIGGMHGDVVVNLHPSVGWGASTVVPGDDYVALGGFGEHWSVAIPTLKGVRLKSVTFARFGNAAADFTATVAGTAADGTAITPAGNAVTVNNAPAAWADSSIDFTDTDVTDGVFHLQFAPSAVGLRIGSIRVHYSKPAN